MRFQKQVPDQADFNFDLLKCTWNDVLQELEKAHAAVFEDEKRGKKWHRKAWRALGTTGDVFAPGLVAIPNNMPLCVLQGGLAVIFSVSRSLAIYLGQLSKSFA